MNTATRRLSKTLEEMAPPPCEKYNCTRTQSCKNELKACEAFRHYVSTGASCPPDEPVDVRLKGRGGPIVRRHPKVTHKIYQEIYAEV